MRRIGILVATAVPFMMLGLAFAQDALNPERDPAAGARLFVSKGCAVCHPLDGGGGSAAGPDLRKTPRPLFLYDFAARMWNHVPQMSRRIAALDANRPYLNADEMGDLMAFVATVDASGRPGTVRGGSLSIGKPGDRQRGEQVVAEKGCLACHALAGQDVRGKAGGPFARWSGFDSPWITISTIWNHAFLMDIETRRQNRLWPRLTAAEMADLVAFLAHR